MQRNLLLLLLLATLYAAVIATLTLFRSNASRIGYVNSMVLMERYEPAVEARTELNAKLDQWRGQIQTLEQEIGQLQDEAAAEAATWDRQARESHTKDLERKREDLARFQRAVSTKASELERELTQSIFDELNAYIEDFGRETGMDMIFGTISGGNILYAHQARDLTEPFLAYIRERS